MNLIAGETGQPTEKQQKPEEMNFEGVWREMPTRKGGLKGGKLKPFAEGIAKP